MARMGNSLIVNYISAFNGDPSAITIWQKNKETSELLKVEIGEQADVLYRLLTEQMAKAEIKAESAEV